LWENNDFDFVKERAIAPGFRPGKDLKTCVWRGIVKKKKKKKITEATGCRLPVGGSGRRPVEGAVASDLMVHLKVSCQLGFGEKRDPS